MTYFKLNDIDFSMYVNKLKVAKEHKYTAQTSASGLMQVKSSGVVSRIIEVGIIPLDAAAMKSLIKEIDKFTVTASFLDPATQQLVTINGIIPENAVDYYTIQGANNTKYTAFSFTITEAKTSRGG